jgi:uncharacterized protein YndB with AHSA1/START domain
MSKTKFTVKREELRVVVERTFSAPRAFLFKMVTSPKSIPNWWGPRRFETIVDKMNVREGGAWRFLNRDADGHEYAFHGIYISVDPPNHLSYTSNFEGISGDHETVESATFEDDCHKTKMIATIQYKNLEDLDGMVSTGMESGTVETWERLAELVET